jgi:5-methylcytosine-specific restriction endonuclease McrA
MKKVSGIRSSKKLKPRAFKSVSLRKRRKVPTRTKLIKELDKVFSVYIRQSNPAECYTCGKKSLRKNLQCGHYVSRSVRELRWVEDNCRPQCYGCNVMQGGQVITFRENLVRDNCEEFVKEIEARRRILFNPTDEWLQSRIEHYRSLIL